MSPRILIGRNLPPSVVAQARSLFDVEYRDRPDPLDAGELRAALTDYDGALVTLGDRFDAKVFADAGVPRAKILANFGMGFNHIDTEIARSVGITVTNTPGAVTDATADIALTLMLMSCRRAAEGERLVRSGQWQGWHPVQMLGLHMSGKTVGILGMGRIGQAIAKRCHFGFGMQVFYTSRSEKTLDFPADYCADAVALAAEVDVLVVSLAASPATHHAVSAEVIGAMKPTAYLVNVARGDIVDEAALTGALKSQRIAGAGLDVYENEPEVPEALRALDNVTLLPHLGTSALEVREDMGRMAVENLRAFFAGEPVPNPV
ncbi:D-glycerate dehydrogenase [Citreicella sp. C3M06]|uniref:2-hydroxyacid dehydrogenase n=1 Tax=Citreicella sp. C3M06 TaxID=2841564 RepID=UPI001C084F81|nr:D-glycerate dehydrogenase [Citreicella sp. C3M06]MBU2960969.1 D-glycerate dehydrogenase [Citreicella sp. C3M06]